MTKKDEIFRELEWEIEHYSPNTKRQYRAHLSDYLDYVGSRDWKDREILHNYLQKLAGRGLAQSHINYIVRGPIGAIFRAHGLRLPIKLPRVSVAGSMIDLTSRVQFTSEEIIAFIKAARDSGEPAKQAVMALSTIYGPRASEILPITKEDVHPKKKTVVIHTLKYGLKREHLVPEQIQPYIFGYDYPPINQRGLYILFNELSEAAGVERRPRKVYHAIRHGLASELIYGAKIPDFIVYQFLRWRGGGMLSIYATPYLPQIDQEIFKKHTFLKYWGKD